MNEGNIDIKTIFPKITFEKDEKQLFNMYLKSRGLYLYKQVYDALDNWLPETAEIKYRQFSNLIRYDKGLRDKLYIYLAAAEEYLRNIIFDEIEIDNRPKDTTDYNVNINNLRKKTVADSDSESNLYYCSYSKKFDFGFIEKIFEKFNLAEKYGLNQLDIIETRKLRNKVMHHNMILLSCFTDRQNIEKEINSTEIGIESLYRILPTKELREGSEKDGRINGGLTQAINRSNFPDGDISGAPYNNLICLHKFKKGRFIR